MKEYPPRGTWAQPIKKTHVNQYGQVVLTYLPYSKLSILNYSLQAGDLTHQERFVMMHVIIGRSLQEIGDLMKGIPNRWGQRRNKGLSRSRVGQLRDVAMVKMRLKLEEEICLNLMDIELDIMALRKRAAWWHKIKTGLDCEGKEQE